MSVTLEVTGVDLEVDSIVADGIWEISQVHHRGDKHDGSRLQRTGAGIVVKVSDARIDDFAAHIRDAKTFLESRQQDIRRLVALTGVERASLNILLVSPKKPIQMHEFPDTLIRLLADCGLALHLSLFVSEQPDLGVQAVS